MKKIIFTLFLISTLSICQNSYAQNLKTIKLKDGSQIKGNISSLNNGVYSVETSFGAIEVAENNIVNIASEGCSLQPQSKPKQENQMMEYEQKFLNNPQMMSELRTIAQDPEILSAFSDPEFAQAAANRDFQKIQNNPKFKELLRNPKMQKLINSASQITEESTSF